MVLSPQFQLPIWYQNKMPIQSAQIWICDLCEREEHKPQRRAGWIQREIPNHYEPNQDREFVICPACLSLLQQPEQCPKTPLSPTS